MATHRYWRLNFTKTNGYCGMAEIELRDTPSGSDLTGSGTATASYTEGGKDPANAVDDNTDTDWGTYNQSYPQWWQYDFGAGNAYDIIEIAIYPRSGYPNEAPEDLTWQYSDNDSDWYTQRERT